ncbi:MAG: hypothetical protein L3J20_06245 [Flavobacteriaceae bacterium]|nr:hypothetical protein [Flavobacteriaceae bacterium]
MNFLKQLLISALFLVIMPFCFAQFSGRPYKEQATAEVVLHHYIYKFDPRIDILPKNLNPEHVVEVVRRELRKEKMDSDAIKQIVELADFYNLQSNVRDFLNWLQQKTPSEEQFLNSIVITRAVGILGQGEQLNKGVEYFNYLLGSRYSRNYLTEILNCYGEYNLVISGDVVGVRVKEIMEKLAKEATNDPDAASLFNDVTTCYHELCVRQILNV